jgi:hypothetical protein
VLISRACLRWYLAFVPRIECRPTPGCVSGCGKSLDYEAWRTSGLATTRPHTCPTSDSAGSHLVFAPRMKHVRDSCGSAQLGALYGVYASVCVARTSLAVDLYPRASTNHAVSVAR